MNPDKPTHIVSYKKTEDREPLFDALRQILPKVGGKGPVVISSPQKGLFEIVATPQDAQKVETLSFTGLSVQPIQIEELSL